MVISCSFPSRPDVGRQLPQYLGVRHIARTCAALAAARVGDEVSAYVQLQLCGEAVSVCDSLFRASGAIQH